MTEVKTFRITGEVKKPRATIPFSSDIRAMKDQDAIDRIYAEMGSRHKAKRREIKLTRVEELKSTETETAKIGK